MRPWVTIGFLGGVLLLAQEVPYRLGRLLFELRPGYSVENLPKELRELGSLLQVRQIRERFPGLKMASPVYVVEYQAPLSPPYAAKLWARSPAVLYAEPEYIPQP
jgi:hypothetical protein